MNSILFDLLSNNEEKNITEYLVSNGKIKPYCPIYFVPKNDVLIIEDKPNIIIEKENNNEER